MNKKIPTKNVWATEYNQSPFGFFKNIMEKIDKNEKQDLILTETKKMFQEKENLIENEICDQKIYQYKKYELFEKYEDFISDKKLFQKVNDLKIANNLIEKGMKLLENLELQKSLKNFESRNNYILISYEIRKVFIEILKKFNNLKKEDNLVNLSILDEKERDLEFAIRKNDLVISNLEGYITSLEKLVPEFKKN